MSGARPGLVWVVEREADDGGRDALAVAVQLADVDRRADLGVLHRHPAERDVRAQQRRPRAARYHADLGPAHVHAVPVRGGLVPGELEPDQRPLRRGLAPLQATSSTKSSSLVFSATVKPMPASSGSTWSSNS